MIRLWRLRMGIKIARAHWLNTFGSPIKARYKRIYHIHIRKSGGTTVNEAFWQLAGLSLKDMGKTPYKVHGKLAFARHNTTLIQKGCYFYANSHMPVWDLRLPSNTYTFTVLREPINRLWSLYKYLYFHYHYPIHASRVDPQHQNVIKQTRWLGYSFREFLNNLPRRHRENQLYMFSSSFSPDEAIDQIRQVNAVFLTENLAALEVEMNKLLKPSFCLPNNKRSSTGYAPHMMTASECEAAQLSLKDEITFYNKVVESGMISNNV